MLASRMSNFTHTSIMIFILFIVSIVGSLPFTNDLFTSEREVENCSTRHIMTKRGIICGRVRDLVVKQHIGTNFQFLRPVEQYLGIPYASPPVGELRFMPPGSAPKWSGTKMAMNFGPVCPQKFPDTRNMRPERKKYFEELRQYLQNQSEDCLYLNVYAPFQNAEERNRFPVMVFLHGESFEWNSGNPYDGSVLASYGRVIVVTLNFRLGILGFLKDNFGLVDQIAALLWVQENIEAFGGDPNRITVFGHGSGAACASLLMLSPMAQSGEGNKLLFQRAILMGGSALSDWALAKEWHVLYQASSAFNCPVGPDFLSCLGKKRLNDLMEFTPKTRNYTTRFGPVVDGRVIPNNSLEKLMTTYNDLFRRFDLMLGTSEVESIHLLNTVALTHGLLEKELLQELKDYLAQYCEMNLELCINRTLEEYKDEEETNEEKAIITRNTLLDILSDARTVAPLLLTAKHHAPLNPDTETFFYVFAHRTASKAYVRDQTYHGEELPYIFGAPLVGANQHFTDYYTEQEQLLSEAIMTYWSNFAYEGNPNVPVKDNFNTLTPLDWMSFRVDWPNFDNDDQQFLFLAYPPTIGHHYRSKKIKYWHEIFPDMRKNYTIYVPPPRRAKPINHINGISKFPPRTSPPIFLQGFNEIDDPIRTPPPEIFGKVVLAPEDPPPGNIENPAVGQTIQRSGWTKNTLIILGSVFLAANLVLFLALYYKCSARKKSSATANANEDTVDLGEQSSKAAPPFDPDGCNFIGMIVKASKNEAVKVSEDASSSKAKLTRNMSSSTLDAHTKVREWITQEIVQRCSPGFLRRSRDSEQSNLTRIKPRLIRSDSKTVESNSSLGRSPTRPVSPLEENLPKSKVMTQPSSKKSSEKNNTSSSISKLPLQQSCDKGKHRHKVDKVSVAVDATPATRGSSVMKQQPIELTKSLDCTSSGIEKEVPLRRSVTMDDICSSPKFAEKGNHLRKSTTNINIQYKQMQEPTVVKIQHFHSRSDPVQDLHNFTPPPKLKTFTPGKDVNVTSRDETENIDYPELTPEQALMTIKRRNFPKVLPDLPNREALIKRRSMPVPNAFLSMSEGGTYSKSSNARPHLRLAPVPPPRTSSALGRQGSTPSPMCQSAPVLAAEPPLQEEPELTCNNLYFGPLKTSRELLRKPETKSPQEIYESLKPQRPTEPKPEIKAIPKAIVTANPDHPIKRLEPKIVIKPKISRNASKNTGIPRVTATDNATYVNLSDLKPLDNISSSPSTFSKEEDGKSKSLRQSQIPTKVKHGNPTGNKGSSSSESTTPSEESDTGTVVKRT